MIPLVVRSYYSLLWGVSSPKKICAAAKQRGYDRLALTDTDNLYGLWSFLRCCKHENIRPIIGAELTDPGSDRRTVCLVENDQGYRNLCRLITCRHTDGSFDLKSAVPVYAKGLYSITQSPELLMDWYDAGINVAAAAVRKPHAAAFRLRRLSRYLNIPMVATPGSFFVDRKDEKIHRVLRAIDCNTSLSRLAKKAAAPADAWLAPASEYAGRFAIWPDVVAATRRVAERLSFTGPRNGLVLPPWDDPQGQNAEQLLRKAAYSGARERYGNDLPEPIVARLEHELKVIRKMEFSSYFLVVKDIVSRSPRICGRGSGAASLVAYCLQITNVCPVKHNLYFERFLHPGRSDPPDIDVDFAWDERDDVLHAVLKQYDGCAALICNHVTFQPRMAIREVAKVFGLTEREIGSVTKRLPRFWRAVHRGDDLLKRLKQSPELGELDFPRPWPQIIRTACRIIGVPRYLSVHPGGVVITPNPLTEYVPIETAPKGFPIIQWEKDAAEESGLVKIDLLGNRSLGVIRDAIANVKQSDMSFDEPSWEPEDDPDTQANVARGNTMGCFYIESPAMRLLQKKTTVGDFNHLVIHSSIIRPAANDFIREYIRRLHGGKWKAIHPLLEDVLEETFGIMVFQEDVAKTAMAMAGFSHVDADGLRKIMSKKDNGRHLNDHKERFAKGARARGVTDSQIDAVWAMMMSFSGYSFCKPHSASYARVSFQAAYLKTHYPAEFMAAVISNQGGFYSTFAYVSEARRMGVEIRPPDVNRSERHWLGASGVMRVGLMSIKHVSARTGKKIVARRKMRPYHDVVDFLERVQPEAHEVRSLIRAGALDTFHPKTNRAALLWDAACWQASKTHRSGTGGLFAESIHTPKPSLPTETKMARLRNEFSVLGFLCDCHPLTLYADTLKRQQSVVKAKDLSGFTGRHVSVAGLLVTAKIVHTKHGEPMEFLTFEDDTGLVEVTLFPKVYRRFCSILDRRRPFLLHGKVEADFSAVTMTVNRIDVVPKMF